MELSRNDCVVKVHLISHSNDSFCFELSAEITNAVTDTDFIAHTMFELRREELQRIKNSYNDIIGEENTVFSFVSAEQDICFWVKRHDDMFRHKLMIRESKINSKKENECNLFLNLSKDDIKYMYDRISALLDSPGTCTIISSYQHVTNDISFEFIEISEYIDISLFVCTVKVVTPCCVVCRNIDTSRADVLQLKKQIERFLQKEIQSFDYTDDFLEIFFTWRDDFIEIEGEISDFSPQPNEIKFYKTARMENMNTTLFSLDCILQKLLCLHPQTR